MENWGVGRSFHGAVSVFGGTGMKGGGLEAGGSDGRSGGRKFSVNRFSIQGRVFACCVKCVIL